MERGSTREEVLCDGYAWRWEFIGASEPAVGRLHEDKALSVAQDYDRSGGPMVRRFCLGIVWCSGLCANLQFHGYGRKQGIKRVRELDDTVFNEIFGDSIEVDATSGDFRERALRNFQIL